MRRSRQSVIKSESNDHKGLKKSAQQHGSVYIAAWICMHVIVVSSF